MVTSSVENLINDQRERVIRLLKVAFSRAKKKFQGKQMMSDVFSKVADEIGVKITFSELVPEEPWEKRIALMAVTDCHLLLCKLEARVSDDG